MKVKQVFDFYSDAAHGWLKVNKKLLKDLNIADKITSYSYMKNDYAYLEEDCDASLFIKAYQEKYNVKLRFNEHYSERSKIRTYDYYRTDEVTVITYGKAKVFYTREQAIKEVQQWILGSEGAEQSRYCNVLSDLLDGKTLCTDDDVYSMIR